MIFAVTDIETTGSHASGNSITEIAIVLTDGKNELDRFETLLRPDHPIPYHITTLTGIDNEMVADAPLFEEVADEIESFLAEGIFVAHNVGFDYSFIKKQFEEIGRSWNPTRLCTVRLTRKLVPGLSSYSLGNLCRHFGIQNNSAHRAMSDTLATVELLHHLVSIDQEAYIQTQAQKNSPNAWLPNKVKETDYDALSDGPGVYYFRDEKGELLYIGMSGNVKKRVKQHFTGKMQSSRRQSFLKDIAHIECQACGSEFLARLLEDHEIRQHWPKHNKAQKTANRRFGIIEYQDQKNYLRWGVQAMRVGQSSIISFHSAAAGREWLHQCAKAHFVNPVLFGLADLEDQTKDSPEEHAKKLSKIKTQIQVQKAKTILKTHGRTRNEMAIVYTENEEVLGYSFFDLDEVAHYKPEDIWENIQERLSHSPTAGAILRQHLLQSSLADIHHLV
ncbi:MAG: exonuclease domain-containing protein [Flavobacteriales bacterium]|nr:exonuclease domain-containing protein [Flavobacteriales bacterium]MDG1765602.1 exonuclease domain-containing protein [Flavobacteriales bacterium]